MHEVNLQISCLSSKLFQSLIFLAILAQCLRKKLAKAHHHNIVFG